MSAAAAATRQLLRSCRSNQQIRRFHLSPRRFPSVNVYFPECSKEFGVVKKFPFREGANVDIGDVVAEVEAGPHQILEVASPRHGSVAKLLRKEGELVKPGEALVELEVTYSEMLNGWWRALQDSSSGGERR
eukprot:TRINITY_DN29984_c0_g1_i2.p1 TRINITY_DN29984_c0_g1~~TRINITY_DN29984_c0_g1_i2.p1  ORF type:complete len:142 (-),score=31.29 TRINITY_DN29984_c0_g1_i2:297-692(-)